MMSKPDYERAWDYVLQRLEHELPPNLHYHGIHHTRDDVVPAAIRLAEKAELDENQTLLLKTAALYHDVGFVERYEQNEDIAARIADKTLPSFGYQPEQVEAVKRVILATKMPQTPNDLLEKLMCDADLDSLGREDYFEVSNYLRMEQEAQGIRMTALEWFEGQLVFLSNHRYFSSVARSLRDAGKHRNIQAVKERLKQLR